MGHSENRGRRGLTLPLQPRAKLIGLSILIAGIASLITSAQLDPIMAQVERVIDGDTIRVRYQGKTFTVRLIGVDTPETKHPTEDTVDRYGRLLRYVLLDGDNFNARLIREGYAHAYRRFPSPPIRRSGRQRPTRLTAYLRINVNTALAHDSNTLRSRIQDIARNCDPPVKVLAEPVGGVFAVYVRESAAKPAQCSDGFFWRQGAVTQKLNRDEIRDFFRVEGVIRFDLSPCPRFRYPEDFDREKELRVCERFPLIREWRKTAKAQLAIRVQVDES